MDIKKLEVPVESLCAKYDPAQLPFDTTENLPDLAGTVGQDRAVEAIKFGLAIKTHGYNMYLAGQSGTGKMSTVRDYLDQMAGSEPVPPDWAYLYNFVDPYRPTAVSFKPGVGAQFAKEMDDFVEAMKREIPRAFESENYEQRRQEVVKQVEAQRERLSEEVQKMAKDAGFSLEITPVGIMTVPIKDGKPMGREEFDALPDETKAQIKQKSETLQETIADALRVVRQLEKQVREGVSQLDKQIATFAIEPALTELRRKYAENAPVIEYVKKVEDDILENLDDFRAAQIAEAAAGAGGAPGAPGGAVAQAAAFAALEQMQQEALFAKYKVNVLINNAETKGAPVVVEYNPTYYNLFGRVDYKPTFGTLITDTSMIKPGAMHKANGGFLVVMATDLFTSPMSWDSLKRMLKSREIRIENLGEQYTALPTTTLRPEPIPLNVKVIIVGSTEIWNVLSVYDEDFKKLFKVKADFSTVMDKTQEHVNEYASFIAEIVREHGLKHFDRTGVARIIEYSSRLLEDQRRLSARFNDIAELIDESSFWASKNGNGLVTAADVQTAIDHKEFRSNLLEERLGEFINDGTVMIDTAGAVVGQVNGLSVLTSGDYMFGKPSRITARTAMGEEGVVNIERETKLSGPIFNKGFMILNGFLRGKFGQSYPLSVSGSITMEQNYGGVEGDSASSAETYALLSSLSDLPLKQNLAVTGSVNQKGEVQAIGGGTRKIEGFFDTCKARGLTGDQGVLIPKSNVQNLMLKDEVVQAVKAGKFRIYQIATIDEGIEVLTGVPAGEMKADGTYPEGTVYAAVDAKLRGYAKKLQQFEARGARRRPAEDEEE